MGADDAAGERLASETDHPPSLAERSLRRHPPEVGAVCGKAARTVLCGGRSVMGVPTASPPSWFAALHESVHGISATSLGAPVMSASGGEAVVSHHRLGSESVTLDA